MKKVIFRFSVLIIVLLGISFSNTYAQDSGTGSAQSFVVAPIPVLSFAVVYSISSSTNSEIRQVTISDMDGCVLINESFDSNVAIIDYSTLSPNLYVITVSGDTQAQAQILAVNFPICPPYCP